MKKILALAVVLISSVMSFNAFAGGKIAAGKALVEKFDCASCHGADFNTPKDAAPKLAGQHENYLVQAMITYKRANGPAGRNNAVMVPQINRKDKDGKDVPLTYQEIQ